jgi:hypothetical protein
MVNQELLMAKSHLYQMYLGSTYFVSALGAEGGPAYDSGAHGGSYQQSGLGEIKLKT